MLTMPGISVEPPASITVTPSRGRLSPGPATVWMRLPCTSTSPGSRSLLVPSKIITLVNSVLDIFGSLLLLAPARRLTRSETFGCSDAGSGMSPSALSA